MCLKASVTHHCKQVKCCFFSLYHPIQSAGIQIFLFTPDAYTEAFIYLYAQYRVIGCAVVFFTTGWQHMVESMTFDRFPK